jgi:quercetin dioxygenase-like cupin family protein
MFAMQLNKLQLDSEWLEHDSIQCWRSQLPLLEHPEIESFSVVYFEIDPGDELALHTHDADEIVVLFSGSGEGRVGDETVHLSAFGMVFVPANAPHGIRNTGNEMMRAFGVFPTRTTDAVFNHPVMPHGVSIFRTDEIPVET